MSLRSHLTLLVVASLAPLVLFSAFLVQQDLAAEIEVRRMGMRDTVRALSLAVDRELASAFAVLETVAASPDLAAGDLERFHAFCRRAMADRDGAWIVLFDDSGQQVVNSRRAFGSALPNPVTETRPPGTDPRYPLLPVGGAQSVTTVLRTGKPAVSDLFVGLTSGAPALAVAIPILRDGRVAYVLELSVQPGSLLEIFKQQKVPPEWTANILDGRGLAIARTVNFPATLAQPLPPELAAQIVAGDEGEGTGRTREGVAVYNTFRRCTVAPWVVSIGISREVADARMHGALVWLGGGVLATLVIGLTVAWFVGRRISASISALAASAPAFAQGERPNLGIPAVREVRELHRALVAAGEWKRAHDEKHRQNIDLDRRVQDRTTQLESFIYTVAHDLRAPLRAMQGFAELVLEDAGPRLEPEEREYLRRITRASERMDALVRDLLAYSRLGLTELQPEPVDLGTLVREVLDSMEPELRMRRANVVAEGGLPNVLAHRPTLFQALSHLLSNAVKFVAPGATPRVRIAAQTRDGRVRLRVEDNGIGVDPRYQEKLFGVFERLHTDEEYPGTGIGLAIVKRAIERMGGTVGVEPRTGEGSVFWFELPEAVTPSGSEARRPAPPPGAGR